MRKAQRQDDFGLTESASTSYAPPACMRKPRPTPTRPKEQVGIYLDFPLEQDHHERMAKPSVDAT